MKFRPRRRRRAAERPVGTAYRHHFWELVGIQLLIGRDVLSRRRCENFGVTLRAVFAYTPAVPTADSSFPSSRSLRVLPNEISLMMPLIPDKQGR